jgi:hypothetical protein
MRLRAGLNLSLPCLSKGRTLVTSPAFFWTSKALSLLDHLEAIPLPSGLLNWFIDAIDEEEDQKKIIELGERYGGSQKQAGRAGDHSWMPW